MLRMCLDDRQWGVVVESVRCFHSVLFCGVTEGVSSEVLISFSFSFSFFFFFLFFFFILSF